MCQSPPTCPGKWNLVLYSFRDEQKCFHFPVTFRLNNMFSHLPILANLDELFQDYRNTKKIMTVKLIALDIGIGLNVSLPWWEHGSTYSIFQP